MAIHTNAGITPLGAPSSNPARNTYMLGEQASQQARQITNSPPATFGGQNYNVGIPRQPPVSPALASRAQANAANVRNPYQNMLGGLPWFKRQGHAAQTELANRGHEQSRGAGERNLQKLNLMLSTEPVEQHLDRYTLAGQVGVAHADLLRKMESQSQQKLLAGNQLSLAQNQQKLLQSGLQNTNFDLIMSLAGKLL